LHNLVGLKPSPKTSNSRFGKLTPKSGNFPEVMTLFCGKLAYHSVHFTIGIAFGTSGKFIPGIAAQRPTRSNTSQVWPQIIEKINNADN
jgi:hypothetical protein